MTDYLVHFILEAVGSLIALAAYKTHKCPKGWHRLTLWAVLTGSTTVLTIQLVG